MSLNAKKRLCCALSWLMTVTIVKAAPILPTVLEVVPSPGPALRALGTFEVIFTSPVVGVESGDLLVNGIPATSVTSYGPDHFLFEFTEATAGTVAVRFAPDHGITDGDGQPFAGGQWDYTVNAALAEPNVIISEFMADNDETLNDENGDSSDWIELFNPTEEPIDITEWALTNERNNPFKWRFPDIEIGPKSYLVVFASEKNRVDPAGKLHTNFRLAKEGGFLGLVSPSGVMVSTFSPLYPPQREDVSYGRDRTDPELLGYFQKPTPGSANLPGGSGFAPPVLYSRASGSYTGTIEIELSAGHPDAQIRYVVGTNVPTEVSALYAGPITLTNSAQIRARAFQAGLLPGEIRSETYLLLSEPLLRFKSDLPVIILHNLAGGTPSATVDKFVVMQVFEPKNGVTSLTNAPDLTSRGRFRKRGSSTEGNAKWNLAVETWNEYDDDNKVGMLGMPEESDWVFYGPNAFEPIMIHNPFMYQLSRDIGRYAPRTRFAEVYINTTGGVVRTNNYFGIYAIEEKIKRGADRVDVDKLEPEHRNLPEVSGGYMLKIDRPDPGDTGFSAAGATVNYVDPKGPVMRTFPRLPQRLYLSNYFKEFGAALNGPNYRNPESGYAKYADVPSWIDHHVLNVLAFNVDALVLSTYFYKPREGKLTYGPIWDFDRALGSTDGRDANPRVWGANYFTATWWNRMFRDIDFWQKWIDRYQELRGSHFSTTNLNRLIDELTGEIRQAQPREFAKWRTSYRGGSYNSEIQWMKTWLSNRVTFIDRQLVAAPVLSLPEGNILMGTQLAMTVSTNAATIYYTLDGTDPRAEGGGLASGALIYQEPITLNGNARVFARAQNPAHRNSTGGSSPPVSSTWSGNIQATYVVETPRLAITEVMFNPAEGAAGESNEEYEYLELKNAGVSALELEGFSLAEGVRFTFGAGSLQPGERIVVVKNRGAFEGRYGGTARIAGQYEGTLDNAGERLVLLGPLKEPIIDFNYTPTWQPMTDGHGFSLVLRDEAARFDTYGNGNTWGTSARLHGSPGTEEPASTVYPRVVVNEVLAHPDSPQRDSVELLNLGDDMVDIGGWYLSDNFASPKKYRFPDGTIIPPGGFLIRDETDFNPGNRGFSFSALGEEVYLFSASSDGELSGYVHGFTFGASPSGSGFGRHVTTDGREHFVMMADISPSGPNGAPKYGPAVLSEIHFEPPRIGKEDNVIDEFIEIQNVSRGSLALYDAHFPVNTWRIRGGVDFEFPMGVELARGGRVIVVSFDPFASPAIADAFQQQHGLGAHDALYGPYRGKLGNLGDRLSLRRPDTPQGAGSSNEGEVPYIVVDEVVYGTNAPWPTGVAGTGRSLQRIGAFANEPLHWTGAIPTPLKPTAIDAMSDADSDGLPTMWEAEHGLNPWTGVESDGANGDADEDGLTNVQEYQSGTDPVNRESVLRITSLEATGADRRISVSVARDRSYSIYYRENLTSGEWAKLRDVEAQQSEGIISVTDSLPAQNTRYYRVVTPKQP